MSSEKWARREKLNIINFANKGKKSSRTLGVPKRDKQLAPEMPKERLPRAKTSPETGLMDSGSVGGVYRDIMRQSSTFPVSASPSPASNLVPIHRFGSRPSTLAPPKQALDKEQIETIATSDSSSSLNSFLAQEILAKPGSFVETSAWDFYQVILMNAKIGRYEEALKAFEMKKAAGYSPSMSDYNAMMDAYANGNRLDKVVATFEQIKAEDLMNPFAYGILIKALTRSMRLSDAFRIYTEMRNTGVDITQPIYTTLIKGCSLVGDYNRAWSLFEHMRGQAHNPDEVTYSHMIHVCAKTGNVEKALNLLADMKQARLYPVDATYNSLIHACAKRPDYYKKTFELVMQMKEAGFQPSIMTYNYMMMACSRNADIWRAKGLWNEILELSLSSSSGSSEVEEGFRPTSLTVAHVLECYNRAPGLISHLCKLEQWATKMDEFHKKNFEARMGLENAERIKQGLRPVDINEWLADERYDPDEKFSLESAFGNSFQEVRDYVLQDSTPLERFEALKTDALEFISSLPQLFASHEALETPHKMKQNNMVLNALIEVYGSFGMHKECMDVFDRQFQQSQIEKDEQTFRKAIQALFKDPLEHVSASEMTEEDQIRNLKDGWRVFQEYEKHRILREFPERWDDLETKYIRSRYQEKRITHEHRLNEFTIYRTMIMSLTRFGDLFKATNLFETMLRRGHLRVSNATQATPDKYSAVPKKATGNLSLDDEETPKHFSSTTPYKFHDFAPLLEKARDSGLTELESRISELLQEAKRGVTKLENESLERQATTVYHLRKSKSGSPSSQR